MTTAREVCALHSEFVGGNYFVLRRSLAMMLPLPNNTECIKHEAIARPSTDTGWSRVGAWTGTLKNPTKCLWRWEPDRRSYFFFSPPAHLCAVTYMTEISLIVTLNKQFNSTQLVFGSKVSIFSSVCKTCPHNAPNIIHRRVRIPPETYIFILNFELLVRSSQHGEPSTNEIKHDIHPE